MTLKTLGSISLKPIASAQLLKASVEVPNQTVDKFPIRITGSIMIWATIACSICSVLQRGIAEVVCETLQYHANVNFVYVSQGVDVNNRKIRS